MSRSARHAVLTVQCTIVAISFSLSVAGILRFLVTPQIAARLEMIAAALKRWLIWLPIRYR